MARLSKEVELKLAERDRARKDLMFLATKVLGYDFQPDTHDELFANYFPISEGVPFLLQSDSKDIMILWPRGHFKTTSVVARAIQIILNFPDVRIMIMQGSLKTTKKLLQEIASHFLGDAQNSRLTELFPEFCGTKATEGWKFGKKAIQLTAESFTVPCRERKQLQAATVFCASPRAIKTGQHCDCGFFDDLINDSNYRNPDLLKKVQEDFDMCQPLIDPGGYRCVTGTRYAFGELYEVIAMRALATPGKWTISIKTCWREGEGTGVPRFPRCILPDGRPIGFTRDQLLEIQRNDPAMFAGQYLNSPISDTEQKFTDQMMLEACTTEELAPPLTQAVLFVDLASSQEISADDSVILAGKNDASGRMYVVDIIGGQWSPNQLAVNLIGMALKHRPLLVKIEHTSAAKYFVDYLLLLCRSKGIELPIDYIKVNNTKDAKSIRIAALAGWVANKTVRFFTGLSRWEIMLEQFTHWPKAKGAHDDYPDTVALMVQELGRSILGLPVARPRHPYLDPAPEVGQDITQSILNPDVSSDDSPGGEFCC